MKQCTAYTLHEDVNSSFTNQACDRMGKMRLALFLHAYQPPTQFPEVTQQITKESYRPIVQVLVDNPHARLTLNLTGSLTEQLVAQGENNLINDLSHLVQQGQVELTTTAAYHPLLAKITDNEIQRQIRLNNLINDRTLDGNYRPQGIFLPEMFYKRRVAENIVKLGYSWFVLDESAFPGAGLEEKGQHLRLEIGRNKYQFKDLNLSVFFRNRPLSLEVAFNPDLTANQLVKLMLEHYLDAQESYALIAVDAETFGHHIKTNLTLLSDIMNHPNIEPVTISELLTLGVPEREIEPLESTWGMAIEDARGERTFPRWDNPENPIHKMQWELYDIALKVGTHTGEQPDNFDKALHSDQFWWSSHNPCWHPEMLKRGVQQLIEVISTSPKTTNSDLVKAQTLAAEIVQMGQKLFGEVVVGC